MKIFAISMMGLDKPIYAKLEDIAKLVKATNSGAKLVMVGQSFINPASISNIVRAFGVENEVDVEDEELRQAIESPNLKRLT